MLDWVESSKTHPDKTDLNNAGAWLQKFLKINKKDYD